MTPGRTNHLQDLKTRRVRVNETDLYWAVGARVIIFGSSDMEVLYSRADEVKTIHIDGPIFLRNL